MIVVVAVEYRGRLSMCVNVLNVYIGYNVKDTLGTTYFLDAHIGIQGIN